jgi:nucleotide-binding universal stress UspA family protein
MENKKYKILVLSDLKEGTDSTLKNAISLSKIIDADIEFFHVKKPTEIVERESQLSAMRTINKEYLETEKKIKNTIEPISRVYDMKLKSSFAFGNVKSEINDYLNDSKPDVVVIGKRKSKSLGFIGDNITKHILKTYNGAIMIASKENGLEPENQLSLGMFNNNNKSLFNLNFIDNLLNQTTEPVRSFSIGKKLDKTEEDKIISDIKVVDYVFEKNDNVFTTVSNYLLKNKVNLLFVDRDKNSRNHSAFKSEIKDMVSKTNVSVFFN